ncbi:hypothetical protein LA52FAK_12120 [Desulforhopalus sp. 52FAK]
MDYLLPYMTGIRKCEQVKKSAAGLNMKIFQFIADDQAQIKTVASTVDVDNVVIKSPDAGEIVSLVSFELL